jgi:hypothetical protein
MPIQTKTLYGIVAILIAVLVIVSGLLVFYYYQYNQAESLSNTYASDLNKYFSYRANVLIDYGNGSLTWYNDTRVGLGENFYNVTISATSGDVNATCCEYGSHFVTGINGLQGNNIDYWALWTYNNTALWQSAPVGADELSVQSNQTTFGWEYCGNTCPSP